MQQTRYHLADYHLVASGVSEPAPSCASEYKYILDDCHSDLCCFGSLILPSILPASIPTTTMGYNEDPKTAPQIAVEETEGSHAATSGRLSLEVKGGMGGEFLPNINNEKHEFLDSVSDKGIVVALDEQTDDWTDPYKPFP